LYNKWTCSLAGKRDEPQTSQIKHFATAFIGTHLQGREDYARYLLGDFVSQFDDLAWGIYNK